MILKTPPKDAAQGARWVAEPCRRSVLARRLVPAPLMEDSSSSTSASQNGLRCTSLLRLVIRARRRASHDKFCLLVREIMIMITISNHFLLSSLGAAWPRTFRKQWGIPWGRGGGKKPAPGDAGCGAGAQEGQCASCQGTESSTWAGRRLVSLRALSAKTGMCQKRDVCRSQRNPNLTKGDALLEPRSLKPEDFTPVQNRFKICTSHSGMNGFGPVGNNACGSFLQCAAENPG